MSNKYNVLWLDDEPIKALESIGEQYSDINFNQVDYMDICENELKTQPHKYHAVILDANGKRSDSPDKDANKRGFLDLVNIAIENHILLYIYSGQLLRASDGDTEDIVLEELKRLGLKDRIFLKSGGPYDLIDKIVSDFEEKYQYYVDHKYILDFFSQGWLENDKKSSFMDPLMEMYCEQDYKPAHGNFMRNIVEGMLVRVNDEMGGKLTDKKIKDKGRTKSMIDAIVAGKITHTDFIAGPLSYIVHIMNEESHNALPETDKKKFFEVDFGAFFLICEWFHKFMTLCKHDGSSNTTQQNKNKDDRPRVRSHQELHTGNSVPVDAFWDSDGNLYFKADSVNSYLKRYLNGKQPKRVYIDNVSINTSKGGSPQISYWVNLGSTMEELDK